MYKISGIFVLVSMVVYTNAAVALFPVREKPAELANQDGCYLEHLQKVIPYGDYYPKNTCGIYTCYESNMTQFVTCGVQVIDKSSPCELIRDESQEYPGCCPWVMCHTIAPEATSESSSQKTSDLPKVEHVVTSERATDKTTENPVSVHLLTESATGKTTEVPVVEHLTTSSETDVNGTSAAPSQNRHIDEETINELLIAQASINN